jgi:alkylhydroperoxidase family enzyme
VSRGERELIATFVSSRNRCKFCTSSHAAFAVTSASIDTARTVGASDLEIHDTILIAAAF